MLTKDAVLITGGAGYIGSHAVLALADAGWPVVVLDNLVTGFAWAIDPRATFIEGDVGDAELLDHILSAHRIGAIMHFAGSVVVPESISDPLKYYANNTGNSRILISAAVASGVRHMIFSSTAATYGNAAESPVREETPQQPINPYGMSKLMTEIMLRDAAAAHSLNYCTLRYFNVAGADPEGRTGQSTRGATHLIKIANEVATGQRTHAAVFGTDYATHDGTGVRDYIHVSDLAAAHLLALERLIATPDTSYQLNCGYGRGFSVFEVLDAVERVSGVTIERRLEPRRAGDPDALIASNDALMHTLGWQPRFNDLDTIVGHALAWERSLMGRSSPLHPVGATAGLHAEGHARVDQEASL